MTTRAPSRSLAAVSALTLVVGLTWAMLIGHAAPASAHSELVESTPAAGSTLKQAPTEVELVFGEGVQEQGGSIVVSLQDTIVSQANTFAVQENRASIQLQGADQPGTYRVAFRVVSADGHTVRDTFTYELTTGASSASENSPADPPVTTTASTSPLAGESTSDDGSGAVVWVLGAGAIGLALVAALIAVAVRGRRDRSS